MYKKPNLFSFEMGWGEGEVCMSFTETGPGFSPLYTANYILYIQNIYPIWSINTVTFHVCTLPR